MGLEALVLAVLSLGLGSIWIVLGILMLWKPRLVAKSKWMQDDTRVRVVILLLLLSLIFGVAGPYHLSIRMKKSLSQFLRKH